MANSKDRMRQNNSVSYLGPVKKYEKGTDNEVTRIGRFGFGRKRMVMHWAVKESASDYRIVTEIETR